MQGNVMSFKAKINNISKEKKVAPQSVLQIYMLERLLERISKSKYKDNFILKGGMLISAILGMSSRSTMDMDTTVKGFELTEENAKKIFYDICEIELDDDITFKMNKRGPPGNDHPNDVWFTDNIYLFLLKKLKISFKSE